MALANGGAYEIVRVLIENGGDLGSRNVVGKTPLHTFFNDVIAMIISRHTEAIDEALSRDNYGMTPLHYAAWSSKSGPEHLLQYAGADGEDNKYPFAARDHNGRSILHFAAQRGNTAILKYLLRIGIDMGSGNRDGAGQTALHHAARSRKTEAIDIIMSCGGDIHAVDSRGRTALHHAAMANNVASLTKLLELGGKEALLRADENGRTPAVLAKDRRAQSVMEFIRALCPNEAERGPGHGVSYRKSYYKRSLALESRGSQGKGGFCKRSVFLQQRAMFTMSATSLIVFPFLLIYFLRLAMSLCNGSSLDS